MLNGKVLNGRQCISTTIRRDKDHGKGQPKTRVIGPGDFRGGMIHSARFNISHWSLVNGSASIILRMTDVVFENITKAVEVPKGFIIQNEEDLEDEDDSVLEPEERKPSKRSLDDAFSSESKRLSVDV